LQEKTKEYNPSISTDEGGKRKAPPPSPSHFVFLVVTRFLKELETDDTPYAVAVTAFWLIELVYCASFMSCLEDDANTPFELMNTVKRWGTPEFHHYTLSLKKLADKALARASEAEREQAKKVIKFYQLQTVILLGEACQNRHYTEKKC